MAQPASSIAILPDDSSTSRIGKSDVEKDGAGGGKGGVDPVTGLPLPPDEHTKADKLNRRLSARQVQMIAIGGTIGTGLFLGTGKSLATAGPASMLVAYAAVGAIVFMTMLALGEMAAFIPVAGSFCTFAGRFVDDAFGFALTWNYWFNDAVSTAADLVAVQVSSSPSSSLFCAVVAVVRGVEG
jgi:AAT family amino acid transporter